MQDAQVLWLQNKAKSSHLHHRADRFYGVFVLKSGALFTYNIQPGTYLRENAFFWQPFQTSHNRSVFFSFAATNFFLLLFIMITEACRRWEVLFGFLKFLWALHGLTMSLFWSDVHCLECFPCVNNLCFHCRMRITLARFTGSNIWFSLSFLLSILLTHLKAPDVQTGKMFIEVLTRPDDQLIKCIWLAAPGCCLPF